MAGLAAFFSTIVGWFFSFFRAFMGIQEAAAWAKRAFIVALGAALVVAVSACFSAVYQAVAGALSGGGGGTPLWQWFLMGLGMLIPSNAAVLVGCMFTVWLACAVYRLKLEGVRW